MRHTRWFLLLSLILLASPAAANLGRYQRGNAVYREKLAECAMWWYRLGDITKSTGKRINSGDLALELGRLLDREPLLVGVEEPDALLSNTALAQALFGPPLLSTDRLLEWVAAWVGGGRRTLAKRTRFQERGGAF